MSDPVNTIINADCIAGMNSLRAGSVDLVFADPPFNIGYDYDVYNDSLDSERYIHWCRDWMRAVHRALANNGTFWLAIGDEYAAELKIEAQRLGFHCRSWVIWYYTFGVNCSRKFTRSHAHLFHFVKDPANFIFRAEEAENRIPSARQLVYNDSRANPAGRLPDDTWIIRPADAVGELSAGEEEWSLSPEPDIDQTWTLRPQDLAERFLPNENTWYFPRVAGTFKERAGFHGCQMPEQLLARIIRACSKPGALVMDPFSGSGTTVTVAKKLERRYLGFDLSPQYVKLGLQRLDGVEEGDRLDGADEPLMSAPRTGSGKNLPRTRQATAKQPNAVLQSTDAIRDAFQKTHEGYSADRVVVDPALNASFANACKSSGAAGTIRDWNTLLFRLRKSGRLSDIPTTKRTNLSWEGCDHYLFASEIAWQTMLDERQAQSLDEILCDPRLAKTFDAIAQQFAPGFEEWQYRWAALMLRKQAKKAVDRSGNLPKALKVLGPSTSVKKIRWNSIPETPGVYLLTDTRKVDVYVGETMNLRERLRSHFGGDSSENLWISAANKRTKITSALSVLVYPSKAILPSETLSWQCYYARQYNPVLNLHDLRAKT